MRSIRLFLAALLILSGALMAGVGPVIAQGSIGSASDLRDWLEDQGFSAATDERGRTMVLARGEDVAILVADGDDLMSASLSVVMSEPTAAALLTGWLARLAPESTGRVLAVLASGQPASGPFAAGDRTIDVQGVGSGAGAVLFVTVTAASGQGGPSADPSAALATGVLYEATTAEAFGAWDLGPGWSVAGDLLVSSGDNDYRYQFPSSGDTGIAFAPFTPPSTDYIIEADISFPRLGSSGICMVCYESAGGILARVGDRSAYAAVVQFTDPSEALLMGFSGGDSSAMMRDRFDPGTDWHSYRLSLIGNVISLEVDGEQLWSGPDNTATSPGMVGMLSNFAQVSVRSYRVLSAE